MESAPEGEAKRLGHKTLCVKRSETASFAPTQGRRALAPCRAGASVCHCTEEVPIIKEIPRRALGRWEALGNVAEFELKTVGGGVARGCYIAAGSAWHPASSASWYGVNRCNKTD